MEITGYLVIFILAFACQTKAEIECPPTGDITLPNPADCSTYYRCVDGVVFLMECPLGLEWNAEAKVCDYPENAKCTETETKPPSSSTKPPSSTTPGEYPTECPPENGDDDVLLPNPDDCGSFFKCLDGIPHLIECPEGQEWADELKRCDWPEVAKCSVEFVFVANECPADDGPEDVLLPNPADCGSFFKCSGGVPVLTPCPGGLHWSVELNRCEYPAIANCKETEEKPSSTTKKPTESPEGSSKPPVERPDQCPAEDGEEDVLLPNPDDCGSFFKCLEGEGHLIFCPPGLHWSIELNRCEYPSIAKCEKKKLFGLPEGCPPENGEYDVLLPNPEDCNTYYQCDNGIPILKDCPVGTVWNAPMSRCDFPNVSECAK